MFETPFHECSCHVSITGYWRNASKVRNPFHQCCFTLNPNYICDCPSLVHVLFYQTNFLTNHWSWFLKFLRCPLAGSAHKMDMKSMIFWKGARLMKEMRDEWALVNILEQYDSEKWFLLLSHLTHFSRVKSPTEYFSRNRL